MINMWPSQRNNKKEKELNPIRVKDEMHWRKDDYSREHARMKEKRDDDEDGVDVIYHLLNTSCAKYSNRHRRHRVKDCCPIIIIIIFG